MNEPIDVLQLRLGHRFERLDLLVQALTHSSYAAEHDDALDNERLEFLGDAIVNSTVTLLLWEMHPDAPEGTLSWIRHRVVSTQTLAKVGRDLALGPLLRVGRGEDSAGGRTRNTTLENAAEAVFGALYLDGGFSKCQDAARRWFVRHIQALDTDQLAKRGWKNPRNSLQEHLERHHGVGPTYRIVRQEGLAHAPTFHAEVYLRDQVIGVGQASSKRAAFEDAAETAMSKLETE
jgi:ribonuclease III